MTFTNTTIHALKKRISISASKAGLSEIEDVTQEILCRMLEGKHQHATIDQAVIDYQRIHFGRHKLRSREKRLAFNRPVEFIDHEHPVDSDVEIKLDCIRCLDQLPKRKSEMFILYYLYGFTMKEIAGQFDVTEAAISLAMR